MPLLCEVLLACLGAGKVKKATLRAVQLSRSALSYSLVIWYKKSNCTGRLDMHLSEKLELLRAYMCIPQVYMSMVLPWPQSLSVVLWVTACGSLGCDHLGFG